MTLVLVGTGLFLSGGLVALFVRPSFKGTVSAIFAAAAQPFLLLPAGRVLAGGGVEALTIPLSFPLGPAALRLDPLAAFFTVIISLGGLGAAVYSAGYMKMYRDRPASLSGYAFFSGLLCSAMVLVVTVQHALLFLVVWEIMSLASFFLVGFDHSKEDVRKAAVYYLVAMQVGAACLLTAFAWSSSSSGSPDFASFGTVFAGTGLAPTALFLLFFVGFGLKAGFVPFHTWLPLAHPAAPTGVSALMSGVMIKTGIYGILRILLLGGGANPVLGYIVFFLALATGVFGVMNAIAQPDLKKLLAYHSIENIGIIGLGIGLGMIGLSLRNDAIALFGFFGALLHVFNHFTFKSLLFYGAGVVYMKTHTRNIELLGGLARSLPLTSGLFLVGSAAICGLPLFSGFISEFGLFSGLIRGLTVGGAAPRAAVLLGLAGLAFIGAMAVLCFTKVYGVCFLGSPRVPHREAISDGSALLLGPMFALTGFILLIGLCFPVILPFLDRLVRRFVPGGAGPEWAQLVTLFQNVGLALAVLAGMLVFFIALRRLLLRRKSVVLFKTWDCGYQGESPRFQYTASSFASPFLQLVAPLVPFTHRHRLPDGLFPEHASLESHAFDLVEIGLIRPLGAAIRRALGLLTWIQTGRTQNYILYGLVFLIVLIVWIIGVR